jgi:hypothetical protein
MVGGMLVSMGDMRVVREQEISPLRFAPVDDGVCGRNDGGVLNWSNTTGHLVKIDKLSKEVIYDKDQSQI